MSTERARRTAWGWAMGLGLLLSASLPAAAGVIPLISSATPTGATGGQIHGTLLGGGSLYTVGFTSVGVNGSDIWVGRWNPATMTLISTVTFNGSGNGDDEATGLTRDPATGNLYVVGSSSVTGQGPLFWIGKLDPSLNLISSGTFAVHASTAMFTQPAGVVLAPNGNLYAATPLNVGGNIETGLVEFDSSLNFVSSATFFNGFSPDFPFHLAADSLNNLYVAGAAAPSSLTSTDIWLGKYTSSLVLVASATVAGAGNATDNAEDIQIDPTNSFLFVAGYIINAGVNSDIWVAKYSLGLTPLLTKSITGAASTNSSGWGLVVTSTRVYVSGGIGVAPSAIAVFLGEFDYSLNLLSSGTFHSGVSAGDYGMSVAMDTAAATLYVGGEVAPTGTQVPWLGKFALLGSTPTVAISFPVAPFSNVLATFAGTASPGNIPVTSVQFRVRDTGTGFYWNPISTNFDLAAPSSELAWSMATTGNNWFSWSASSAIPYVSGHSYDIIARSQDQAGQYSVPYATSTTMFDNAPPVSFILSPPSGSNVITMPLLSGTAADSGAGISAVTVQVSSGPSFGTCWNGSVWTACPASVAATGTGAWNLSPGFLPTGVSGTKYLVTVKAVDSAGNVEPVGSSTMFNYFNFGFTGGFPGAAFAATANGQNEFGTSVTVDTVTAGGPFIYEIVASTTGPSLAGPMLEVLVQYNSAGSVLGSAVLPGNSGKAQVAVDNSGFVYVFDKNVSPAGPTITLTQYAHSGLAAGPSMSIDTTAVNNVTAVASDGVSLYTVNDSLASGAKVIKYNTSLTAVATATYTGGASTNTLGNAIVLDGAGGVYVNVSSASTPGAETHLLKFNTGLTQIWDSTITALTPAAPSISVSTDHTKVYTAGYNLAGNAVFVRAYNASNGSYTGNTSTTTGASNPLGLSRALLGTAPSGELFVGYTNAYDGTIFPGRGDYQIIKLDSNLNFEGSRNFNGPAGSTDTAFGMAVLNSTNVIVTGASRNGSGDYDAVTVQMNLTGIAGGQVFAQATDLAPSTAPVSAPGLPMLRLGLWSQNGAATLNSLSVGLAGNAPASNFSYVSLYEDTDAGGNPNNGDGVFEPGTDTLLSSAPFAGAIPPLANLNVPGPLYSALNGTTRYFFLTVTYGGMSVGRQLGLVIPSPGFIGLSQGFAGNLGFPLLSGVPVVQQLIFANPSAQGAAAPSSIPAPTGGFDTGFTVQVGQSLLVTATGTWNTGGFGVTTATGVATTGGLGGSLHIGSLVGRVGGGAWFQLGSSATVTTAQTGDLFLAMNDTSYFDNSGQISVGVQVLVSTQAKIWTGASGVNVNASINANWLNGLPPLPGDTVVFDGSASNLPCTWDIGSLNIGLLNLTTSYTGAVTIGGTSGGGANGGGGPQLTVSSDVAVQNGAVILGSGATLTVQGLLKIKGGSFSMGSGGSVLQLSKSGAVVSNSGIFTSAGTSGAVSVQAINAVDGFPFQALSGVVAVNNPSGTTFQNTTGFVVGSSATVVLNNANFVNANTAAFPNIVFSTPNVIAPAVFAFSKLDFDANTFANIDASALPAGSTVYVLNATGARMGSPFDRDPNHVVLWAPDGGSSGTISGLITNVGNTGTGPVYLAYSKVPNTGDHQGFDGALSGSSTSIVVALSTSAGFYTLSSLAAPNTYYLMAWRTPNVSSAPSAFDPIGGYSHPGLLFASPVFLPAAGAATSANITMRQWSVVQGLVANGSSQFGPLVIQAWNGAPHVGDLIAQTVLPPGAGGASQSYSLAVPAADGVSIPTNGLYVMGFVDVNGDGSQQPFEASVTSNSVTASAGATSSGVDLNIAGGSSAAGGVLMVSAAPAHPGYIGTVGPNTFSLPQAILRLSLAPGALPAAVTALRVDMGGAVPAGNYQVGVWRDDAVDGVFDDYHLGGAGPFDTKVGETTVPGGVSSGVVVLSEFLPAGTTSTYFVTLNLLGQQTTGPVSVTVSSTSSFGLAQGSLSAQPGLYPINSGAADVLFGSRANWDAQEGGYGGEDAGVSVAAGQSFSVFSHGNWSPDSGAPTTPDGRPGTFGESTLVPEAQVGQLIARIDDGSGGGTDWFPITSGDLNYTDVNGELFLAMNDYPGAYFDNYGAIYSSFTVTGSTTVAIEGMITYTGTITTGSLFIRAGTADANCPGCPNSPFNIVSTITVPMSVFSVTTQYAYSFAALPPDPAYVIDAFVQNAPSQAGNSGFPVDATTVGSTVTAVDFTLALGSGTLAGNISYTGVQNSGQFFLAVTTVTDLSQHVYFFGSYSSTAAGSFSIPNLPTPNTFYIVGFRDVNGDQQPDGPEPFGVVGVSTGAFFDLSNSFTPIFLDTGATLGGKTLTLVDHGAISGNVAVPAAVQSTYDIVIEVGHGVPLSDSFQIEDVEYIFSTGTPSGAPQPYLGSLLRPASDYSVFAFVDVNNDGFYDPTVDPSGQVNGPINVPQGGFTNVDLAIGGGAVPPPPVTGFQGTAAATQVVWTWNLSPGATAYQLRSSTNGIVAALGSSATSFTSVLAPGATSSIVSITAANASGISGAAGSPVIASLPAVPGSPSPAAIYQSSAVITWLANGNAGAVNYQVTRATAVSGPFFAALTTAGTLAVDTGLSPGTTYTYKLQAFNVNGASTPLSASGSVITLPASGPSIGGIAAYGGGQGPRIVLQAFTNSASTGAPAAQELIPTGQFQPFFLPLPANTSYYVRAFVDILGDQLFHNGADHGQFQYSTAPPAAVFVANAPVSISTLTLSVDVLPPATPFSLRADGGGIGVENLSWFAPTTNADGTPLFDLAGFRLQRGLFPTGPFTTIASPTNPSFTDLNAPPGALVFYRVAAVDFAGNQSAFTGLTTAQPSAGGTISGNLAYVGTTTQGPFRVRLSSTPAGPFVAETTLSPFSFTGLFDGAYYVRAFRDLNGDGIQQDNEPGGALGGIVQPYEIPIFGAGANTGSTLTVCDRVPAAFGGPGSPQSYPIAISPSGCPAQDQASGFFTSLLSFRVGGGAAGSVGVGASVSISMQSAFPNRLILLGPDGGVQTTDSRAGGARIDFNVNQPGLYMIEPTSFNPFDAGSATVTLSVNGGFSGTIAGTLSYSGAQTGPIVLQLFPNSAANSFPLFQTSTANPGNYAITGLQDGTYYLRAFRDSNGNFSADGGEAAGSFGVSASTLTAIQVQGGVASVGGTPGAAVNVTMSDPAVGAISGQILRQGSQTGTIRIEVAQPQANCGGCDPTVIAFATIPAAGAFTVPFVPPATNYILNSYVDVNGNAHADTLEAKASVSPVAVKPNQTTAVNLVVTDPGSGAAGNESIQGTISYGGSSTGPLLMAFATDPQFQTIAYTLSQGSTGTFFKSGVLGNTSYYIAAFLDSNNNGEPDDGFGEPIGFYGSSPSNDFNSKQPLFVSAGATAANIVLTDASTGSISGQVTYTGTQFAGKSLVVHGSVNGGNNRDQRITIPSVVSGVAYNYTLPYLAPSSSWTVSAFIDANGNGNQDFGEPSSFFGQTTCTTNGPCSGQPITVSTGPGTFPTYGVNVTITDPGQGNTAQNTGTLYVRGSYLGSQSGPIVARVFTNTTYTGTPFRTLTIPMPPGPGQFNASLQGVPFGTYALDAFRDPSGAGIYNPTFDAYGVLQTVTLSANQNGNGGGGDAQIVDPGQGGSINVYSGSFTAVGGARFDGGAVDIGVTVNVDTITAGGPFLYVQGVTKQNAGVVSSLVKYSSAGVFMASTILPTPDTKVGLPALDDSGNIYLGQDIVSAGSSSGTIVKYSPSLALLQTLVVSSDTNIRDLAFANGKLYATVDGNNAGGSILRTYDASLAPLANGTYSFPSAAFGSCTNCSAASGVTLAVGPGGSVYMVAKSQQGQFAGGSRFFTLLKFNPGLGAPAAQADITGLVPSASDDSHLTLGADSLGNVFLTLIPTGDSSAHTYKFDSSLRQVAATSFGPLLSHFGGGIGNLVVSTDNYVYEAWETPAHGGDFLALRYDDSLTLVSSRTFDGLDNAHEDFAFGLAVQNSSNVYLTGGVTNAAGNLDWATLRLNMNASGASSGAGAVVVISTSNATNAIFGALTYGGTSVTSGTVRAVLLPLGSNTPIRLSSAPFAASVPYLFNNVPAGAYQIQAFDDLNGNLSPDAGEPVGFSSSTGFQFGGASSALLNVRLCDRRSIAMGAPVSATITPADCPAADRGGASQRLYTFAGARGQAVTVEMDAINFYDAYLNLYDPNGNLAASDDDGAGAGNARISNFLLPLDGLYTIGASPFAPGLSSATFKLSLTGSAGSLGSLSGAVTYSGAQGGAVFVGLFSSSSFNNSLVSGANIPGPGPFSFANLKTGTTYFLGAFIDVNGNGNPDAGEDVGLFGSTVAGAAPIFLRSGQNVSGVSFAIVPGFSGSTSSGTFAEITGVVSYATATQSGSLHVQFFSNSSFQGQPVSERTLPAVGSYDVPLPPNVPYYIRAYIDANANNALDPAEPVGVYAPRGQGAEAVFAISSGVISGINIAVADPGTGASGVAGDGLASIAPSTAAAGAQIFSATITYTAGASSITVGGRVGFTVPQGFPAPQFVTATSPASISAPTYSGLSAFVTVTSGFLSPGQQVVFVYNQAAVPCVVSTRTFSVSASQNGLVPLTALFAGSPALQVLPGPVSLLQPSNPYISLTQGALSDPQSLEAHDVCGNRTPLTAPLTATLRAKRFDLPTASYLLDPTVGLSSAAALSTSTTLGLSFAVGQSSAAYFAVSASTGGKNLEVFYSLNGPTTFYYGMTALPAGALSNASVSTVSFAAGASSAAITPNGDGNADLAYLNFTMADPTQPWHILIASAPIKAGVAPMPVWESWGQGQPRPGQIAWDGRFSPSLNGGARVPSGFYYVRIELGGSGVHDDSLIINVSVPQLIGHILDAGVLPNPPLSGVNVQIYGPNGTVLTQTDALGGYVMPGIVAGAYNMFFNRPDFLSGMLSVTVNAAGSASTFTALSNSSGTINAAGGLDVLMTRSSVLLVAPSLAVGVSTQAADLWGGLQIQSSTSSASPQTLSAPLHVAAGTTTFDDGGQWDPSVGAFVAHTLFRFNVAAGTYTVTGSLPGVSVSTASVYVGPGVVTLNLPPFNKKSSVSGLVTLPSNAGANGTFVSVNAIPLSTSTLVNGGFGGVFIAQNVTTGTYVIPNLDAGAYLLRANVQAFAAISTGPIAVPASSDVAHVDFPAFTAGASISGVVTVQGPNSGTQLTVSAWAPGSLNFGSTQVVVAAGTNVVTPYSISGLSAGTTYQVFANLDQTGNVNYFVPSGLPILTPAPQAALSFSFVPSSGIISGTILLPAGSTDFLDVSLTGVTLASAKPDDVGHTFAVASATSLPNFLCQPGNVSPDILGYCVGKSSASFTVQGENTETLSITFFDRATGQTVKKQLSVVNGSTTTVVIDLSPPTFSISGAIANQITNALFNTNPNIVANAPLIAPLGYPAGISATTARVEAILIPDITQFNTAISSSFNPATTRVGYLTAAGTYTVSGLPSGSYLVRTVDLRSCATCSVLVPSVSQTVNVAGNSLSNVNFALSDGFTAAGTISLDGGIQDSQIFAVTVFNQRQEVVRSTNVALGDPNLGLAANAVDYSFSNLPANGFYTLTVAGIPAPSKYAGSPIQFPNPALSPAGLQSNLSAQNVVLQRAAMIVGRLKDANTGALIGAAQAGTLAPNFQISATANPWTNGGFVLAASSVAGRPIQADGYFRVGPLIPNVSYDLKLSQTNWDAAFLLLGSQNYSPVTVSGLTPQPGEVRDVGVISLNQGQSLTGTVRQSTTTGALLGGIEIDAVPSFNANGVTVQTFTNPQGRYTLWVSTFLSNTFNVTAAPRGGANVSSGTVFGQVTINSVNLLATTTADFLLNPLLSAVTSQVVVEDAASGGLLAYPFGANRGFPAAAINLQPQGVVPTVDALGDIEAVSDQLGSFSVPGLSTGAYAFKATSLGYSVFNATVAVSTSGFHIYTTSDTPSNFIPGNVVTLRRGATLTGRIVKSDGTAPNNQEVGGIAAANFPAGEYLIGSVDIDKTAKTVNSYTISGFKPGVPYSLVILPADKTSDSAYPPEGANVSFAAVESTTTKNLSLTYLPSGLDCLATSKGLGNGQFQIKIACTKALRNSVSADNDLSLILAVSSSTSLGTPVAAPNGTGQFLGSDKSLSQDRRQLTAIYRTAANETGFSLRIRASASSVDPKTGANFAVDKVFDFLAGLDSNVNQKISNINGGTVSLEPSGNDDAQGLDERSRIDLPPGVFAAGLDTDPAGSAVAGATVTVSVGLSKAKSQQAASALFMRSLGYVPNSVATLGNPSAFPAETWAAMSAFNALTSSTSTIGGANPLSSFYSIFLPAGIRHQLKEQADVTFSYNTSLSTSTDPNKINVWFFNATLGKFVLENTNRRLDTNSKTITVAVNHFSVFVVLDGAPAVTAPGTIPTADIIAFNFPNPSDCVVHSNVTADTRVGFPGTGIGSTFNPFKGTMIRYSLPPGNSETTTIRIYSLSGQLVRTIDQGAVLGNTTQYFPWACDNQSGKTIASGVYIGEVQWGSKHKYFKIAIVKGSGL